MRLLLSLCCALCLPFPLSAQISGQLYPGLDLSPNTTYSLEVQRQWRALDLPIPDIGEVGRSRMYSIYTQDTKKYQLKVLAKNGSNYEVELVRILSQSLSVFENRSANLSDIVSPGSSGRAAAFRDTVHFSMDQFGKVVDLVMPDSTAVGYVIPDTFQVQMEAVMPELILEFQRLMPFFQPEPLQVGDSWANPSGERFTLLGQQAGLWHIRSSFNRDLYLDPQTRWISFMQQEQPEEIPHRPAHPTPGINSTMVLGRSSNGKPVSKFSGQAPSHKSGSLLLRVTPYYQGADNQQLIQVDENGRFSWQDTISEPFFFQLTDLYSTSYWGYARPGGELILDLQEDGKWKVSGPTTAHCRYLNAFFERFPQYQRQLEAGSDRSVNRHYKADLEQFWQEQLQDQRLAEKQLAEWAGQLDPEFVALQNRQIDYFRAGVLAINLSAHLAYRTSTATSMGPVPDYYQTYLDHLILYNDLHRRLPAFRALLHQDLMRRMFSATTGDIMNIQPRPYEMAYYFAHLQYQNFPLLQTSSDLLQAAILWQTDAERTELLYRHFQGFYKNAPASAPVEEMLRRRQALQTMNNRPPDIAAFDSKGKTVHISDFSGKPAVLIILNGRNYWQRALMLEELHVAFPDIQFVFLHIGPEATDDDEPFIAANVHHWYTLTNSAAAATAFLQYSPGNHRQAYLLDRSGKMAGVLQQGARYDSEIIQQLTTLLAGPPLLDKQTRRGLLLILLGLAAGGLIVGLLIHQWQKRLRRREHNRRQLVETQLRAIRSQLNPHFMFNSMSSIQHLIKSGQADQAQSYLGKLANLLRAALRHTREEFISLQEELDVVMQYCELEALRFNFSYDLQIDRQLDTRAISIPPLLLQPYVENAVLHGIAPLRRQGKLQVNISESDQLLWIRIRDNGPGMQSARSGVSAGNGLGLELNAERLRLVYGAAAQVRIFSPGTSDGISTRTGTEVQIAMPLE